MSLRCAGTLLGGGGALGSGGAIQQFVPDPSQRQQLFESVAYDCQINQQPDEARELFMAAQKPRAALKIINQQLSAAIHANKGVLLCSAPAVDHLLFLASMLPYDRLPFMPCGSLVDCI